MTRSRRDTGNGKPAAVKIIKERERFGIVFLQTGGAVLRFRIVYVQVAVRAEIPHRQIGKKLVGIGSGVGTLPQSFVERAMILPVELRAEFAGNSVVADVVREFMHANAAAMVFVLFKFQQIFLATRGEPPAHAARALVARHAVVSRL